MLAGTLSIIVLVGFLVVNALLIMFYATGVWPYNTTVVKNPMTGEWLPKGSVETRASEYDCGNYCGDRTLTAELEEIYNVVNE